ncbi:DUF4198 domain-containing protein [Novosphingobium sp.]|uniref:DUF4198 domain-containing protein n=1 Tax=Novosphingobium sp. TaxID=1874826 RepID=UPI0031DB0C69
MRFLNLALLATAATLALPTAASAHRAWIVPAATNFSGEDPWASFDAAISNDLFFADHFPMQLAQIKVTAPDGSAGTVEHGVTARYRSTFDVHLTQEGTWRIGTESTNVMGSFKVNGVEKRVGRGRGGPPPGAMPGGAPRPAGEGRGPGGPGGEGGRPNIETVELSAIPADATDLKLTEAVSRNEVFVTRGKPTETFFKPTGKGLEFAPITHPDDLVQDQPAKFRFLLDGKPAVGLKLTVIPGGKRYRDAEGGFEAVTDKDGVATIKWPQPGLFWFTTSTTDNHPATPRATERRLSYTGTVEVMAP